ncbi:ammonium transporter AmtB-like domain-containing protein [Blyttiomyces helicus]|uniref:Ammonium transporter n=1 Tax=Blyttiomyces helicus TaxID=388810 RepID=A0A4P9WCZ3_9FUNG|nr:ammonium transporter AmtB-like domain-containing protein [Blyttiomyces helicus]|eukprot:RKO89493.1 ammonium transporter AmtB-like domain-containing protein [Blyttiomyces helicus]
MGGFCYASTGFLTWGADLVFIVTPGLGFFYSGMTGSKNAPLIMRETLTLRLPPSPSTAPIRRGFFGFFLAFSESGSAFIGDFAHGGLKDVGAQAMMLPAPQVPSIAYSMYQLMFATITPALIFGSVAERVRLLPAMIFVFLWATVVYDPAAYWTWGARGWIHKMGAAPCNIGGYDYAGGGPVHISSGFAGLAYCIMLGRRRQVVYKAHNMSNVFLGTALLWLEWFGFNGGSAVAATPRAAMAAFVTTIAASCAALSWVVWDYSYTKKLSGLGFCSGAVAGLVAITPASGYVAPWAAIIIGILDGVLCNVACRIKAIFGFDDTLDAWGVHGLGGFLGNILTGVFAQKWIGELDGTTIDGGWVEKNWRQVGAIAAWSFVVSMILLAVINKITGLHIRPTEEDEDLGADLGEMGEVACELVAADPNSQMAVMLEKKEAH